MKVTSLIKGILIAIPLGICLLAMCCTTGGANSNALSGDTVAVEVVKMADSSSFVKGNGEKCSVIAEVSVDVPVSCGNTGKTEQFRALFAKHVLYAADTTTIDEALKVNLANTLHQYAFSNAPDGQNVENDNASESVKEYRNSINITISYNDNGIATFSKVEIVKKDNQITSVTHRYYNIDTENMCYVSLDKAFKDDCIAALCGELKSQLMRDNNVTSIDQLNEVGFFNIDNLELTSNFYIDKQGVTWSFLPNELSVEALGEPKITLKYEVIEPFLNEDSPLKRLY